MKRVALILSLFLLTACASTERFIASTDVVCVIEDTQAKCTIHENAEEKERFGFGPKIMAVPLKPVIAYIVVELSKGIAIDVIKEQIIQAYKERFKPRSPVKLVLLPSH